MTEGDSIILRSSFPVVPIEIPPAADLMDFPDEKRFSCGIDGIAAVEPVPPDATADATLANSNCVFDVLLKELIAELVRLRLPLSLIHI